MPLLVNLRHLEEHNARFQGELSVAELDIDTRDEAIQVTRPLRYDLEAQQVEGGLLLQGHLQLTLDCQCVRCLKPFPFSLDLKSWACHVPLEGEDQVPVISDCVDLTPLVREDILLEFPRHPLCDVQCRGLPKGSAGREKSASDADGAPMSSTAWAELNKLKF